VTINKNTAIENGEGSLDNGATGYEFMQGYYDGCTWCDPAVIPEPQSHNTQSPNTQPPMQGGIDWITVCNNLEAALVSSCNILVNPDNTLTAEGERAVGRIRNGIVLAGGGTLVASLPLPLVIAAPKILEEPTGCGGIVEWEQ
jgi:hypothetical protein